MNTNEWQPIESAPKDGRFIGLLPDGRAVTTEPTRFVVGYNKLPDGGYIANEWRNGWVEICYDALIPQQPTHWMPLPAPPVAP